MEMLNRLKEFRAKDRSIDTPGLSDEELSTFLQKDSKLLQLIDEAQKVYEELHEEFGDLLHQDESKQVESNQTKFLNFYDRFNVNPFVALAAKGPWVLTTCGSVIYDTGGYGMLGFGQNPEFLLEAMKGPKVMANVMTANFSQLKFITAIEEEIGHNREDDQAFDKYLCVNSGSEAMTVACRIADIHAKTMTDPGAKHHGKKIMNLSIDGSFHGRTDPAAQLSKSNLKFYESHLASFRDRKNLICVPPNDTDALKKVFEWAKKEKVYFQIFAMEPVMGEGNPGLAVTPEYYKLARTLTREHDTLLLMDSIQAGLRAHGSLSVVDYPGFEELDFPDMEAYSKALNGGQYPLSVLALNKKAADLYKTGIYGNTMTTNPRALDVATQMLEHISTDLRKNIETQGAYFLEELTKIAEEYPDVVTNVQGTGLLFAISFDPKKCRVVGEKGLERHLRQNGLGVIHGGENALRFTPIFTITKDEADLVIRLLRKALHVFLKT